MPFAKEVGYPVVAKPDNGVGASHTFKITSDEEMKTFFEDKWPDTVYIMEEYIWGEVNSYDAIIDSNGKPMFETGNVSPVSIMDIVNEQQSSLFYILKKLPADTRKAGRATVKAFGVKSRFVHFEFFRLQRDHEGLFGIFSAECSIIQHIIFSVTASHKCTVSTYSCRHSGLIKSIRCQKPFCTF